MSLPQLSTLPEPAAHMRKRPGIRILHGERRPEPHPVRNTPRRTCLHHISTEKHNHRNDQIHYKNFHVFKHLLILSWPCSPHIGLISALFHPLSVICEPIFLYSAAVSGQCRLLYCRLRPHRILHQRFSKSLAHFF